VYKWIVGVCTRQPAKEVTRGRELLVGLVEIRNSKARYKAHNYTSSGLTVRNTLCPVCRVALD
jgi:hypothetical protein